MDCDLDPMQELDEYDGCSNIGAEDVAMQAASPHLQQAERVATTMDGDHDPMADAFLDDPDVADGAFDELSTSGQNENIVVALSAAATPSDSAATSG